MGLQLIFYRGMCSNASWQVSKEAAIVLQKQNDSNVEAQTVLKRRINRFYLYSHCERLEEDRPVQRPPVDYTDPKIKVDDSRLTVFGVKFLSNKELKAYFDNNPSIKEVKKINQEAAWVQFDSKQSLFDVLRGKSIREITSDLDLKAQYELKPYIYCNRQVRLFARCFVNIDCRLSQEDSEKIEKISKQIFYEKQQTLGNLLPPRRKTIRKYPTQTRMTKRVNNSMLSFAKNTNQHIDSSLEEEMEEHLIASQNAGTVDDPIDLDLDISSIGAAQDIDQPAIYREYDDGYRFKTANHKTKFKEWKKQKCQPFNYKRYEKRREEEEKIIKKPFVVLDD